MQTWNGSTTPPNELVGEDSHAAALGQRIEDYADYLMAEAITFKGANLLNTNYDLYDGDLLPNLMVAIANWTGSTESAVKQMRTLHNLLADKFQKIAEREVL